MEIIKAKSIQTLAMMVVGAACFLLQGCQDPHIVFTRASARDGSSTVFVIPPAQAGAVVQPTPVQISTVYGPVTACGHTSDGRLVVTIQTTLAGKDIYLADPNTGQILNRVVGTPNDDTCVFVTPTDLIIYEITTGVDSDVYAIQLGSTIGQPVANTPQAEHFLGIAPDNHIIFSRQSLITGQQSDILSGTIGGPAVMLAQVFPPGDQAATFNGITSDNHVIFSEYTDFVEGSASLNIYSINTDGTGAATVAHDSQGNELFCKITSDNHILYTDQYVAIVNGQEQIFGDIYSVNPDGTGALALTPGVNHMNNTCQGITASNYLIFSRGYIFSTRGSEQLYSVVADGKSSPILLADSKNQLGLTVTSYLDGVTPWGRIVYTTDTTQAVSGGEQFSNTLNSIMPDGTGQLTLANNINVVGGFTITNKVIYNAPVPANGPSAANLFSVPAAGGAAPTQLSSSPDLDYVNFLY